MKIFFSVFLYSFSLVFSQIPIESIEDSLPHFSKSKYSPIVGQAILRNGLMSNMRIFGPYDIQWREEAGVDYLFFRDYRHDYKCTHDPIASLIAFLFPSCTGHLSTSSKSMYHQVVKNQPQVVGHMINYVLYLQNHDLKKINSFKYYWNLEKHKFFDHFDMYEQHQNNALKQIKKLNEFLNDLKTTEEDIENFDDICLKINESGLLQIGQNLRQIEKKIKIQTTIQKKIDELSRFDVLLKKERSDFEDELYYIMNKIDLCFKEKDQKFIYPHHSLSDIFWAFSLDFYHTQNDYNKILNCLDSNFYNHKGKKTSLLYQNPEDFFKFSEPSDPLFFDHMIVQTIKYGDTSMSVPYPINAELIENGYYVSSFDRVLKTLIPHSHFTDCVETSIRHLCNICLYDKDTKTFDLSHIIALPNKKQNIEYFLNFYESTPPCHSNNGDKAIRSLWSQVTQDLNRPVHYQVNYVKKHAGMTYEIDTGFVNLLKVYNALFPFVLELQDLDIIQNFHKISFDDLTQKTHLYKNFMTTYLLKYFNFLSNNRHDLHIEWERFYAYKNQSQISDFLGEFVLHISPYTKINYKSDHLHAYVVFDVQSDLDPRVDFFKKYGHVIQGLPYESAIGLYPNTADYPFHFPRYKLFPKHISSQEDRMIFLRKLFYESHHFYQPSQQQSVCDFVLSQTYWDDHRMGKFLSQILPFLKKQPNLVVPHVKKLLLNYEHEKDFDGIKKIFPNLTDLTVSKWSQTCIDMCRFPSLNKLFIHKSKVFHLNIYENPLLTYAQISKCHPLYQLNIQKNGNLKNVEIFKSGVSGIFIDQKLNSLNLIRCDHLTKVDGPTEKDKIHIH